MMASGLVAIKALQTSEVSGLLMARPLASANAFKAFWAFSPSLPSISPGEKLARSRSTCAFTTAGLILSSAGVLPVNSALLTAAASGAAKAGGPRHASRVIPTHRRIIGNLQNTDDKEFDGPEFRGDAGCIAA